MDEKKQTFHITLIDKKTKEVEIDSDAYAVFNIYTDRDKTAGSLVVRGDSVDFANVLLRAEQEIENAYSRNPEIRAIVAALKNQTQEIEEDK